MDVITSFAFAVIVIIPLWRIFERAGLVPAIALIALVPYLGIVLAALILAFSRWSGTRAGDPFGPYQPDLFDGRRR